jgi:hypothetical protein
MGRRPIHFIQVSDELGTVPQISYVVTNMGPTAAGWGEPNRSALQAASRYCSWVLHTQLAAYAELADACNEQSSISVAITPTMRTEVEQVEPTNVQSLHCCAFTQLGVHI